MSSFIYGLYCPLTDELRYIGKSVNPSKRLMRHIQAAQAPTNYNQRWLASLMRRGLKPTMRILREVASGEDWKAIERHMIATARAAGVRLTNTAVGGEGVVIADPAVELRRCAAIRAKWREPAMREAQAERMRANITDAERSRRKEATKARWGDPEYAGKVSAAVKAAYSSPAARSVQAERARRAHTDPDIETRRSESLSAAWRREGAKDHRIAAMRAAQKRPEVRERNSEAVRLRHSDPEQKARMMRGLADPEMIKRRNAAIKAAWARRKGDA